MSLRTKFAILVALLALTISGSMGVALWSFGLQRSQLMGPFANTPQVIKRLRDLSTEIEAQESLLATALKSGAPRVADSARLLGRPDPEADDPARAPVESGAGGEGASLNELAREFAKRSPTAREHLKVLAEQGLVGRRTGTIASRTLAEKVDRLQEVGGEALRRGDTEAMSRALTTAEEIRTLVGHLGDNVLIETARTIETVEAVRWKLLLSVFWAFATAALLAMLALVLVRRWVLRPVEMLRNAAAQIAAGDFKHRVNAEGGDELALLAHEVDHMAEMVDRMLNERVERERLAAVGEMVRRLAHNLRNPLAAIRAMAETTRNEVRDNPELRDNQERIINDVDRFNRWLSDLLSATKPLAVIPEQTRIAPLLTGLVESHRLSARNKDIQLELEMNDAPEEACFDARHLEHSLVAILTNAIQASPAKSTVRVTARSVDQAEWEVRIADQGPGVPPEIADKIFNAYFTTKRDGNGIGLAVAQQVVRAHGGRITIEQGLNGSVQTRGSGPGATFVVRIPVHPPVADSTPGDPRNTEPASPRG